MELYSKGSSSSSLLLHHHQHQHQHRHAILQTPSLSFRVSPTCFRNPPLCYPTHKLQHFNLLFSRPKHIRYPLLLVRSEAEAGTSGVAYPLSGYEFLGKIRGVCFYAVTSAVAILLFQCMLLAHPFVLLFDPYRRKAQHTIAKLWSMCSVALFYNIRIKGLENLPPPHSPAVYVSNHQSFLDIYTLLTLGRTFKFISKTGIFLFPIIGWAMYMLGTIPLKRSDSKSQLETLKRCMDLIKKGASVFFFPEGTRSKDGKLGAFKKGAFSIAAKNKVPVVPITLIGTGKIMPPGRELTVNPGTVQVIIHKPIQGSDAEAMCNEARAMISRTLND
uniref:1-acyl-sn-glycerol-3-phosphate acyltransferase n=1 Tax=Cuphea avigera var. pulcherrima TaxID=83566 RepID=A0A0S1TKB1_9MYRT|nr:plastid lysophosphatidic acid acyltransferase 1 [Cuphea avigera var. pulcherrima]